MPVLKLSYDHLPSNLKHCFAYCSLFPKYYFFNKEVLINLWIAQGYINPNNEKQTVANIGHSYFMDLVRRSFFRMHSSMLLAGELWSMHDLIHDLAIHVAGEETLMLTASSNEISGRRHVNVGYVVDDSWLLPEPLHNVNRLRSLLFLTNQISSSRLVLGNQFANLKSLRALSVRSLGIENVPSSIGELKHLRYLDISDNKFKKFPDSITKLVNLCMLNIRKCESLEVWPDNFGKLINLRHLHNKNCSSLKHLPPGFDELSSLQNLDEFRLDKRMGGGPSLNLDVLSKLKFMGELMILFQDGVDDWDGVECWQLPQTLQKLHISDYKGARIPHWSNGRIANPSLLPKISSISLKSCPRVKCLPPFRHIPNLKQLILHNLEELEYIEDDEAGSDASFIPDLETLVLQALPNLNGWSRKIEQCSSHQLPSFPTLSSIDITRCPKLKSIAATQQIQQLPLLPTSCLTSVSINSFDWLESFPGESLTRLQRLQIHSCIKLKRVDLPPLHLNNLEYLSIFDCPELELWDEKKRGVDWDSLHKLIHLTIETPSLKRLPNCLRRRKQLGQLQMVEVQPYPVKPRSWCSQQ